MNKKVLVLLVVVFVLLGGAGFYLWQQIQKGGGVPSLSSMMPRTTGGSSLSHGDLPEYSLVADLPETSMVVFAFEPRRFDALGTHVAKLRDRFATTALWKKAGLDQLVDQYMNSSMDQVAQGLLASASDAAAVAAAGMPPMSPAELAQILSQEWNSIDEFLFTSDSVMFSPLPGMEAPRSMIAVTFKDDAARERVQKLLTAQVLGGQDELTLDPITLRKKGESRIEMSSSFLDAMGSMGDDPSMAGAPGGSAPGAGPLGAIEFEGNRAYIVVGAASYKEMLPSSRGGTSTAPTLSAGSRWSAIQSGIVPETGAFVYYDMQKFFGFLETLAGAAGMSGDTGSSPMKLFPTKDFEWTVATLHVSDGIGSRQCLSLRADSELAGTYKKVLEGTATNEAGKLLKLVDQNTLLAANVSRWMLDLYSASARVIRLSQEQAGNAAPASAEWDKYQKTIEALGKLYSKRSLKNLGVVVGGPRPEQMALLMGGPQGPEFVPDVGLMLEFGSALSPQEFAELINNTALLLVGDSDMISLPLASVVKGRALADGSLPFPDVVKLHLGEGVELVAAPVETDLFMVAKDEVLLDSLQRRLKSTTPFITQASLASRSVDDQLRSSGMFALISTSSLIELGRSFIPMALMMAPPELQIGMPDVEEVLNLLNQKLMVVSNGLISGDGLYCSDSRAVAL